ncbi:50S ribosomal protein L30 [Candidatus Woesearchaeota archaeon]|nr:50S ribosomal protein L30 [Candidatus Woesearchaeota archaeon]
MDKKEKQLAAVRVRGITEIRVKVEDTLRMLRLYRKNYCAVIPGNETYLGMLKMAKDYITWGEIDDETFRILVDKRGEAFNGKEKDSRGKINYNDFVVVGNKKIKKYFRLSPPVKGFGRKGIKHSFQQGGALGYRGDKINDLIRRMV